MALRDLHQHMYFAVENREKKYCLVGAQHYSLVGQRALFRVCNLIFSTNSHFAYTYELVTANW